MELYPGYNDELIKREELRQRIEKAHATVLPGALREAFAGEPCRTGVSPVPDQNGDKLKLELQQFQLQPVTLGLCANLERIQSPLLEVVRIMREVFSPESTVRSPESTVQSPESASEKRLKEVHRRIGTLEFEPEQAAETVFVFTQPQKRVRKLLDVGRDNFRDAVMDELGDRLHPSQMAALQRACSRHYFASFATIIGYGAPPPEEGAAVFPPPSPGAVTASVGGSTYSAH